MRVRVRVRSRLGLRLGLERKKGARIESKGIEKEGCTKRYRLISSRGSEGRILGVSTKRNKTKIIQDTDKDKHKDKRKETKAKA